MNIILQKLQSDDPDVREIAVQNVSKSSAEDSRAIARELLPLAKKLVGDEGKKGSAKTVILLIGKLKVEEAVPFLVEKISFQVFYKQLKRPQPREDLFPCVQALIDIGKSSLGPLLEMSKNTDDKDRLECAAVAILGILGKKEADEFVDEKLKDIGVDSKVRLLQLKQYIDAHNSRNVRSD